MSNRHSARVWGIGVALSAAAAAMIGMGIAHADTPDDVIGQATSDLNQANALLEAAPTADLSTRQADFLGTADSDNQTPFLEQIGTLQDSLPSADQTYLGSADEQLVTAAQNVLTADQAFVAADQAGDLSSNGLNTVDLGLFDSSLGLGGAELSVIGDSLLAILDPSIATDSASAIDPSIFADLLSSFGL
jgi:hypothetical protein